MNESMHVLAVYLYKALQLFKVEGLLMWSVKQKLTGADFYGYQNCLTFFCCEVAFSPLAFITWVYSFCMLL